MKHDGKSVLNADDLCAILQVSREAVSRWQKEGLPFEKLGKSRGSPVLFVRTKVAEWLATQPKKMHKYVFMLAPKSENKPHTGDSVEQFSNTLEAQRLVLEQAARACRENPDNQLYQSHFNECADNLRKLEKDWPDIQIKAGLCVSLPEAVSQTTTAFSEL